MGTLIDELKMLFADSIVDIWYRKGECGAKVSGLCVEEHVFRAGFNQFKLDMDPCVENVQVILKEFIRLKIKQIAAKCQLFTSFADKDNLIEITCYRITRG